MLLTHVVNVRLTKSQPMKTTYPGYAGPNYIVLWLPKIEISHACSGIKEWWLWILKSDCLTEKYYSLCSRKI